MQRVVLIAHTDEARIEQYLDALDAAGFHCLAARTGSEALEAAASYGPDVAVLQIDLPEVQGTDVCLRLKQEQSRLAVVLLGKESQQERFVGREVGADAFLIEPVEAPALVEKVKEVFSARLRAASWP